MKLSESMTKLLRRSVRWASVIMIICLISAVACGAQGLKMIAAQVRSPGTFMEMTNIAWPVLGAVVCFAGAWQLWGFARHGAAAIRYDDANEAIRAQGYIRVFWTIPYRILWSVIILLFAMWFLNTMLYPIFRWKIRSLEPIPAQSS